MTEKFNNNPGSTLTIREVKRFNKRIHEAVARLIPQLNPHLTVPDDEHIKSIIKAKRTHLFIAELESNKIVGLFTIASYDIPTGTRVWIEDVVVDESERGKGIGKEMMIFAIGFAKSIGAREIDLTSRPERVSANQLYLKLGFVKRETNAYRYKLT